MSSQKIIPLFHNSVKEINHFIELCQLGRLLEAMEYQEIVHFICHADEENVENLYTYGCLKKTKTGVVQLVWYKSLEEVEVEDVLIEESPVEEIEATENLLFDNINTGFMHFLNQFNKEREDLTYYVVEDFELSRLDELLFHLRMNQLFIF